MKKMVKQQNKYWIIFFLSLFLVACTNNSICFDLEKQEVISESRGNLKTLTVENVKEISPLIWIKKKENVKGSRRFSFRSLDTINYIYKNSDFIQKEISYKGLVPNSIYEIMNSSNGDAAPHKLTIETDSVGVVIHTDCNCT